MAASRLVSIGWVMIAFASVAAGADGTGKTDKEGAEVVAARSTENTPAGSGLHEEVVVTAALPRGPTFYSRLSGRIRSALEDAIPLAREHIRDNPSCQALFARLDADGIEILDRTLYYPTTQDQERRYCRRGGSVAITTVGGSVVKPCRSFARLSRTRAAIILIHEALHNAGQTEYPSDPDAPDAVGITKMVMKSCGFF